MDKSTLYDKIAERKIKPQDFQPYSGGNGRVDKCVKLIRSGKLRNSGVLLDVGGAIGDLGYAVKDLFDRRLVQDISEKNLDASRAKGNETFVGDVDCAGISAGHSEGNFKDDPVRWVKDSNFVDLVCALDFIEHIIDPENFARECFRVLKSKGQVFINTPNIRYWKHIVELLLGGTFPHTSGDTEVFHGGHLAFFTNKDLQTIFGRAGFTKFEMVKDEEGYSSPPDFIMKNFQPKTQAEYMQLCMELGCPNLLFIAEKP